MSALYVRDALSLRRPPMRSSSFSYLLACQLVLLGTFGCAGVKQNGSTGAGGNGAGAHGGNGGIGPTDGPPPPVDGIIVITVKCGDGNLDQGEQCDDHNRD